MDYLPISTSKIKITLTEDETAERGIAATGQGNEEKRGKLRRLLDEVKERFGFDIGRERALVQIYPTSEGGTEIFVTRLGVLTKDIAGAGGQSDTSQIISAKRLYYIFNTLESLLAAVGTVRTGMEEGRVYRLDSGEYCLSFLEHDGIGARYARLLEFGRRYPAGEVAALDEHARLVLSGEDILRLA